ncbi:mitochondrial fusion and transport protein ugo1 [Purpureocillium lilacinum]|uniref:mitochondrial fusion and transport protein ugo1 n=1 Tax=Purpureocillium lilacinum TaxID=33203 RepID=UPI002080C64B|nr:mitochondrial fusion and transport protein ugo1 [Purpureocillium lilacinum]
MSTTHREGVNPLRPYYIPPTIGEAADPVAAANANPFSGRNATSSARYASKARDVLADLDYKDYLRDSSPSVVQSVKELVDELIWKYTSVLMAQPFEVAKTILQARDQDDNAALATASEPGSLKRQASGQAGSIYDVCADTRPVLPQSSNDVQYQDSDSEGDEPAYFTSNVPGTPTSSYRRNHNGYGASSPSPAPRKPAVPEHQLTLRRPDSVAEVIGQLWQRDGAWGVWKGSNATFLYTVLQSLLENWSRSFLSAIFNVPDLGVREDIDRLIDIASPYPWVSLFVAGAAAVATGVLLSPLDLVRTKLILSPIKGQRRTLASLRALPSYLCPSAIALPTVLNSLVHPLLTLSTPLVLRTRFMIDSQVSPMTFSVAKFLASSAAILVKLPIETVLRRGQMAVLTGQQYVRALGTKDQKIETIVPIGRYKGVFGTMYHIASEEGTREIPATQPPKKGKAKAKTLQPTHRKGQGLEGLWRGWKVNWWGLVGLWTASVVGHGGEGEF